MADVDIEFDIDQDKITERSNAYLSKVLFGGKRTSIMVRGLRKIKVVKSDEQAYIVLLGIAILLFLITMGIIIYITYSATHSSQNSVNIPPSLQLELDKIRSKSQ